jgi:hypothetical protein
MDCKRCECESCAKEREKVASRLSNVTAILWGVFFGWVGTIASAFIPDRVKARMVAAVLDPILDLVWK